MESIQLANKAIPGERVAQALSDYCQHHHATIRFYDLGGGKEPGSPAPEVTLEDIGRMTLINPDLSGNDAAILLQHGAADEPWKGIDPAARLEDADPMVKDGLYDAALDLFKHFTALDNIGLAKASKLLHLKRPFLFPILDSYVTSFYEDAQREVLVTLKDTRPDHRTAYWAAIRNDLIANSAPLRPIIDSLPTETAEVVTKLSPLRVVDIMVWWLAKGQ